MLKTHVDDHIWMVQQHHHAQVSGYLAAHWGNDRFAQPGTYPGATNPALWRETVILAIAEHDSGWWETEMIPKISAADGLPVGLGEQTQAVPDNGLDEWRTGGFERWTVGIDRLAGPYPYAALLISLHAYWLYAVGFDDLREQMDHVMRHFVFTGLEDSPDIIGDRAKTRAFLDEQLQVQRKLTQQIEADKQWAGSTSPQHALANLRLLQLLDTMSLHLCMNNLETHDLPDVPGNSWQDRVTIHWKRIDARTVQLDPYPFAIDPLPVYMPTRIIAADRKNRPAHMQSPYAALHGSTLESVRFTLTSKG